MKKYVFFVSIALFIFSSCSPKFYSPNTQNVPLISEKGETNLNLSGNGNQVEFQGAYGVAKHIGIQVNGGLFIPQDLDNGNGGSGKFGELGLGYFKGFKEHWIFETYALGGFGTVENHMPSTLEEYPSTSGKVSANLLRVGIQPSFGFKSKHFSAAISTRIVNLSYSKIDGDLMFEQENQADYLRSNSSNMLLEPALTLRGGFERFKLQLQYGYSFNLTESNFRQENTLFTLGLNFSF